MVEVSVAFRLLVNTRGDFDDELRNHGGPGVDEWLRVWRDRFTESLGKRLRGRIGAVTSINTIGDVRGGSIEFGLPHAPAELQLVFGTLQAAWEAVKWVNENADLAVDILDSFRDGIRQISANESISHGQLIIWPARVSGEADAAGTEQKLPDVYILGRGGRIESTIRQRPPVVPKKASERSSINERAIFVRTISTSIFAVLAASIAMWFYLSAAADDERRQRALLATIEKVEQRIVELEKQMAVQVALLSARPAAAGPTSTETHEVRVVTPPPLIVAPPPQQPHSNVRNYEGRPAWIYRTN